MLKFNTILKVIVLCSTILPNGLTRAGDSIFSQQFDAQKQPSAQPASSLPTTGVSPQTMATVGESVLRTSQLIAEELQRVQTENKKTANAIIQRQVLMEMAQNQHQQQVNARVIVMEERVVGIEQRTNTQLRDIVARLSAIDAQLESVKKATATFEVQIKNQSTAIENLREQQMELAGKILRLEHMKSAQLQTHAQARDRAKAGAQNTQTHVNTASAAAVSARYRPPHPPAVAPVQPVMAAPPHYQWVTFHHYPPLSGPPLPGSMPLYQVQQPPPQPPAPIAPQMPILMLPSPAATAPATATSQSGH